MRALQVCLRHGRSEGRTRLGWFYRSRCMCLIACTLVLLSAPFQTTGTVFMTVLGSRTMSQLKKDHHHGFLRPISESKAGNENRSYTGHSTVVGTIVALGTVLLAASRWQALSKHKPQHKLGLTLTSRCATEDSDTLALPQEFPPAVVVGAGRLGNAFLDMSLGDDIVLRRGDSFPSDAPVGPICLHSK